MLGIAYLGRFAEDAVMYPGQLFRSLRGSAEEQGSEVMGRSSQASFVSDSAGGPA